VSAIVLSVPGISCGHCVSAIEREVGAVKGVAEVDVDLGTKLVTVRGSDLSEAAITAAIDEAGYDVA
jgi:copper ion binding protein